MRRNDPLLAIVKEEETMVTATMTGMATCRGGEMRDDTKRGGRGVTTMADDSVMALMFCRCAP